MPTVNEQIGKRIRELRKEKGLTQTQFAEIFNTSQNRITNIETGKSELSFDELLAMAKYFDVPTDYLLKENSTKKQNPELQYICDYTGFSPKTIAKLKGMQERNYKKPIYTGYNNMFFSSIEEWQFYIKVMEKILISSSTYKAFTDLVHTLVAYSNTKEGEESSGEFFSDIPHCEEEKDFALYKIQKSIIKTIETYGVDLFEKEYYDTISKQRETEELSDDDIKELYNEQES